MRQFSSNDEKCFLILNCKLITQLYITSFGKQSPIEFMQLPEYLVHIPYCTLSSSISAFLFKSESINDKKYILFNLYLRCLTHSRQTYNTILKNLCMPFNRVFKKVHLVYWCQHTAIYKSHYCSQYSLPCLPLGKIISFPCPFQVTYDACLWEMFASGISPI